MKNSVFYCVDKGVFSKKTIDLPEQLYSDYALIKYLFCGICGGDYSTYIGRRTSYPISLGHEFVAEVISIGDNVENVHPGQYVVSDLNYRCENCDYCKHQKSHLCIENNVQKFSNRAYAQHGIIHKKYLYKINMHNYLQRACFIEPLSCVIHAIDMFHPPIDMPLLINGVGSIGSMMVFYLHVILHYKYIYINDTNTFRINNIMHCFKVKQYAKNATPPMFIIDCTNDVEGVKDILQLAPQGASLCIMSHLYGENTSFIYEALCRKEIQAIFPLRNGNAKNIYFAIEYIEKYWSSDMDLLYTIDNDINRIFQAKKYSPFNKQIFDAQNAF